jgi:hypothetical protein
MEVCGSGLCIVSDLDATSSIMNLLECGEIVVYFGDDCSSFCGCLLHASLFCYQISRNQPTEVHSVSIYLEISVVPYYHPRNMLFGDPAAICGWGTITSLLSPV